MNTMTALSHSADHFSKFANDFNVEWFGPILGFVLLITEVTYMNLNKMLLITCVIFCQLSLGESTINKAQKKPIAKDTHETYNLRFQKDVNQSEAESKPNASLLAKPDPTYRDFEVHAGLVLLPSNAGSGLSVGGQYNFSRTLGLQAHILTLKGEDDNNDSSSLSASGREEKKNDFSALGASFAAVYTPMTFNESRMPIRVGFLGGLMLFGVSNREKTETLSASGRDEYSQTSHSTKVLPFVGAAASIYFNEHIGLMTNLKLATDSNFSQIGVNAAFLF